MNADDIPVAHTPPGGLGDTFPEPVLAGSDEPLDDGAPDLRGLWRTLRAERSGEPAPEGDPIYTYAERIEQCGDRIVDMGGGTIADARADGTEEHGVHDVSAFDFTTPIHVIATYEDGVFVLRPVGIPGIEVTRRLDADGHMVWTRPDQGGLVVTLERVGEGRDATQHLPTTRGLSDRYRDLMPDQSPDPPPLDRTVFAAAYGPRALVAGGAAGLGAEYCRQIAATGTDLLILDRDESGLDAFAHELRSAPDPVDIATAVVDLAQPAAPLLDAVRRAVGEFEIGLLVANAAWSPVGPFLDSDLTGLLTAIDINCRAPVVLVHELGARMCERGRGGIIVMSSLAAEAGAAQVALYSATKAFDLVLAEGLWYELRDRGVDVVAIRPGSTRTPGWESSQPASGELDGVMEPTDVVRDALAALGTIPSIAAGAANRAAEAMFRGMSRRDVIELMSGITSQLVTPEATDDETRPR